MIFWHSTSIGIGVQRDPFADPNAEQVPVSAETADEQDIILADPLLMHLQSILHCFARLFEIKIRPEETEALVEGKYVLNFNLADPESETKSVIRELKAAGLCKKFYATSGFKSHSLLYWLAWWGRMSRFPLQEAHMACTKKTCVFDQTDVGTNPQHAPACSRSRCRIVRAPRMSYTMLSSTARSY